MCVCQPWLLRCYQGKLRLSHSVLIYPKVLGSGHADEHKHPDQTRWTGSEVEETDGLKGGAKGGIVPLEKRGDGGMEGLRGNPFPYPLMKTSDYDPRKIHQKALFSLSINQFVCVCVSLTHTQSTHCQKCNL